MKSTRSVIQAVCLFTIPLLSACHIPFDCEKGKGAVIEQTLDIDAFEKIKLKNSVTVHLRKETDQKVVVRGQQNLIDLLNTEVNDHAWEIEFEKCVNNADEFEIFISLPSFNEISILGSGDVIGENSFSMEELELNIYGSGDIKLKANVNRLSSDIRGSGDIEIEGSSVEHEIDIAGSGNVSAEQMKCERVNVSIKGSGNVNVHVTEELEVDIMGSGDVYYKGNPDKLNSDIKGSGEVKKSE